MGCVKTSICLQLVRLFWVDKLFRCLGIVVFALSIAWALQTILVGFLICRPLSHNWNTAGEGTCGDPRAAYISIGIVDAITDGMIFALPLPMINRLKMPTQTKLATCAIFALGLVTIVAGIVRTIQVSHLQFDPADVSAEVNLCVWSAVEPSVGITVACMIVMRPLFLHFGERFLSWAPWTNNTQRSAAGYGSSKTVNVSHSTNRGHHSNAVLLNSVPSLHEEYPASKRRQGEDAVSEDSDYHAISQKQSPVHVV